MYKNTVKEFPLDNLSQNIKVFYISIRNARVNCEKTAIIRVLIEYLNKNKINLTDEDKQVVFDILLSTNNILMDIIDYN